MGRKIFVLQLSCFLVVYLLAIPLVKAGRELEKDPIKNTQTDPILVTPELLSRESEPGPASPSFKMSDTSGFFVKKSYNNMERQQLSGKDLNPKADFSGDTQNDWLQTETEETQSTEALDKKELK